VAREFAHPWSGVAEAAASWDTEPQSHTAATSPSPVWALGKGCWASLGAEQLVELMGTPCTDDLFRWRARPSYDPFSLEPESRPPIVRAAPSGQLPPQLHAHPDRPSHAY
jgi:hypothetical protein